MGVPYCTPLVMLLFCMACMSTRQRVHQQSLIKSLKAWLQVLHTITPVLQQRRDKQWKQGTGLEPCWS